MADRVPTEIPLDCPLEHPAVAAWNKLAGSGVPPNRIVRLNKGHTEVYRLEGVGPGEQAVIAKLMSLGDAWLSRTIHFRVLPLVPKPALFFYGCVAAPKQRAWIFLEDAGTQKYDRENPDHRRAVSAWLAALHVSLAGHAGKLPLPPADPGLQLTQLREGRQRILDTLNHVALPAENLALVRSIIGWCDRVEAAWERLMALLADAPRSVVHGDFVYKNIFLRETAAGYLEVFPIDWETTGLGPPAADLGECLDLTAYAAEARDLGARWTTGMIRRWAVVGKILRAMMAIDWASSILAGGAPPRAMRHLQACERKLSDAMRALALEVEGAGAAA